MGGTGSCVRKAGLEGLCSGRGTPEFLAPNTENVTYEFDYGSARGEIKLCGGAEGPLAASGFLLSAHRNGRGPQKFHTVREYSPNAANVCVRISGRALVQCQDALASSRSSSSAAVGQSACALKVCTRGRPIFESVRTRTFTHTAHMVTSGIFFTLYIEKAHEGLFLNPRLLLVLECGDEVQLVDDRLGPLNLPLSFYTDFSILDDGGRNLQMDLIFRVFPSPGSSGDNGGVSTEGLKTLRTCLQEYTTFNNQVQAPCISLAFSDLPALLPSSSVHLQNLVISEEPVPGGAPAPPLAGAAAAAPGPAAAAAASPVPSPRLSSGPAPSPALSARSGATPAASTRTPAATAETERVETADPDAAAGAPCRVTQLAPPPGAAASVAAVPPPAGSGNGAGVSAAAAYAAAAPFLGAIRESGYPLFDGPDARLGSSPAGQPPAAAAHAAGDAAGKLDKWASLLEPEEFWYHVKYDSEPRDLSSSGMHFDDYQEAPLQGEFWLTKEAVDKKHIYFHCCSTMAQALTMCIIFRFSCPTDYLSLIENQATALLRDLHIPTNGVVLGVEEDPRHRGLFRMFVEHRNEILEDIVVCESSPAALHRTIAHQEVYDSGELISYRLTLVFPDGCRQQVVLELAAERVESDDRRAEERSSRWPISPCVSRQLLSPANRILVYSSIMCQPPSEEDPGEVAEEDFATPTAANRAPQQGWGQSSDGTVEDWQSVGGGASDGEADHVIAAPPALPIESLQDGAAVQWRRPLVDTVLLMSRVEEPPFKCVPASMS